MNEFFWENFGDLPKPQFPFKPFVIWITGLSGAGKSTLAKSLRQELARYQCFAMNLDGDNLRGGLCKDLGFSDGDRTENIRRAGEVSKLFFDFGVPVLCSFISPFDKDREFVKSLFPDGRFFLVHASSDLNACEKRDKKGLYKKVRENNLGQFSGISSPYEIPADPHFSFELEKSGAEEKAVEIVNTLLTRGLIKTGV